MPSAESVTPVQPVYVCVGRKREWGWGRAVDTAIGASTSLTWVFPTSPVESILLARLTASPHMSYCGFFAPITPATMGPWLIPLRVHVGAMGVHVGAMCVHVGAMCVHVGAMGVHAGAMGVHVGAMCGSARACRND